MESPPLYEVSDSAASLTSYVASTTTATKNTKKLQAHKQVSKMRKHCPNILWRNYVGDFRLVEFALHVLHSKYPKNERNKTRLTLAPNRGT